MNLGNIGARNLAMVPITPLSGLVDPVPSAEVSTGYNELFKDAGG